MIVWIRLLVLAAYHRFRRGKWIFKLMKYLGSLWLHHCLYSAWQQMAIHITSLNIYNVQCRSDIASLHRIKNSCKYKQNIQSCYHTTKWLLVWQEVTCFSCDFTRVLFSLGSAWQHPLTITDYRTNRHFHCTNFLHSLVVVNFHNFIELCSYSFSGKANYKSPIHPLPHKYLTLFLFSTVTRMSISCSVCYLCFHLVCAPFPHLNLSLFCFAIVL